MEKTQLEMIPCPVCGKPMPKKRLELGYNYCLDCSTEKPKRCLIEGTQNGDGDDAVDAHVAIITAEEAREIVRYQNKSSRPNQIGDEESPLNMRTLEEQDVVESLQKSEDQQVIDEMMEIDPRESEEEQELLDELLEGVPDLPSEEEYDGSDEEEFLEEEEED